jgi:hypothetical protein
VEFSQVSQKIADMLKSGQNPTVGTMGTPTVGTTLPIDPRSVANVNQVQPPQPNLLQPLTNTGYWDSVANHVMDRRYGRNTAYQGQPGQQGQPMQQTISPFLSAYLKAQASRGHPGNYIPQGQTTEVGAQPIDQGNGEANIQPWYGSNPVGVARMSGYGTIAQ